MFSPSPLRHLFHQRGGAISEGCQKWHVIHFQCSVCLHTCELPFRLKLMVYHRPINVAPALRPARQMACSAYSWQQQQAVAAVPCCQQALLQHSSPLYATRLGQLCRYNSLLLLTSCLPEGYAVVCSRSYECNVWTQNKNVILKRTFRVM